MPVLVEEERKIHAHVCTCMSYKCRCMYIIYVLNIGLAVKPLMMQFFVVCLPVAYGENFHLIPMYI